MQLSIDLLQETRNIPAFQELAVYEYCGDSSNTRIPAFVHISIYQLLYRGVIHVFFKPFQVKSQICCKPFKLGII